jgi:two-component system nitrogen regulation sensor histidine kinase NtrY
MASDRESYREPSPAPAPRPNRLPLGRSRRRLSFERRIRARLWLLGLPTFALALFALRHADAAVIAAVLLVSLAAWALIISLFMEQIIRPLQTLSNVVAALREEDYSFRARGARRDDAVGDLALEVNALAATLQTQRSNTIDAIALLERVLSAMQSPVLAFTLEGRLRLSNTAAEELFSLRAATTYAERSANGRSARDLGLEHLLEARDDQLLTLPGAGSRFGGSRFVVRRSGFRLRGVPHTLLVFSDVSAALREQERQAWQRLIRVMGHEINNSLTPIKSIAGSLRTRLANGVASGADGDETARALAVIEDRADSLNRFLQAYAQLSGLPPPRLAPASLSELLGKVARLESRLSVAVDAADTLLLCDRDQLQQALINLVQNAADAALANDERPSAVTIEAEVHPSQLTLLIRDSGAGIANSGNLFVPFYTTKPGGSGIGLVLALQIVEAHGGTVRLRNRADMAGGEAEVCLPRLDA